MIDLKLLRNELNIVAEKLANRGFELDVNKFIFLEKNRKILQLEIERLRSEHKFKSRYMYQAKLRGENFNLLYLEINELIKKSDKLKHEFKLLQSEIRNFVLNIPNIPDETVPIGKNERNNVEIKRWGIPRKFDFKIRDHVSLSQLHDGLNFSDAVKITGSRFVFMKGQIAHLHRALSQFMLDLHTEQHGYIETYVPYLVNKETLHGTAQLPKFKEDLFYLCTFKNEQYNYALIPTAEVPLINLIRNEVLSENDLPIKMTAHSPCFRSEAGSYGKDTHGIVRMHQFDKVELVQIVQPEDSMSALEEMTNHVEKVLILLNLPYRRVALCTNDISFGACKTYDVEVWIPAKKSYLEVSSCSNMSDFQARRIQARYRSKYNKKNRLVHTLNASGLAVGRTLIAVLENYQQTDGSIEIPKVLHKYMNSKEYIS